MFSLFMSFVILALPWDAHCRVQIDLCKFFVFSILVTFILFILNNNFAYMKAWDNGYIAFREYFWNIADTVKNCDCASRFFKWVSTLPLKGFSNLVPFACFLKNDVQYESWGISLDSRGKSECLPTIHFVRTQSLSVPFALSVISH